MSRTTINLDDLILREIKALQKKEGGTLGKIVSRLLAEALGRRKEPQEAPKLEWVSHHMNSLVDLSDKEAVYAILDRSK